MPSPAYATTRLPAVRHSLEVRSQRPLLRELLELVPSVRRLSVGVLLRAGSVKEEVSTGADAGVGSGGTTPAVVLPANGVDRTMPKARRKVGRQNEKRPLRRVCR